MTARSTSSCPRAGAFDPTEWANRRKSAVEKAARLREERRKGKLDDTYTFTPQTNGESNSSSRSNSRQDENDALGDGPNYGGEHGRMAEPVQAQQRSYGGTSQENEDLEDSLTAELGRRGGRIPSHKARELQHGYAGMGDEEGPPALQEITYQPPEQRRPSDSMRGNISGSASGRGGIGAKAGRTLSGGEPYQSEYAPQQSRDSRDLQAGYRDKSSYQGQPLGIKFAGRNKNNNAPYVASSGDGDGVVPHYEKPSDREAHDVFTSTLRGADDIQASAVAAPRGGRRASVGRGKPGWNNDIYVPSPLEEQPPPLPGRPRRPGRNSSVGGLAAGTQGEAEAPPVMATVGGGGSTAWKHKHTRPDWIDSWENQAAAREKEEEKGSVGRKGRKNMVPDDDDDQEEDGLPATARPKLSLLKAKLRNTKGGGRRSHSAPNGSEDSPNVEPAGGGRDMRGRDEEHQQQHVANQRSRYGSSTSGRAQTTPMMAGGVVDDDDEEHDEAPPVVSSKSRMPRGRGVMSRPQVSPRTTRLVNKKAGPPSSPPFRRLEKQERPDVMDYDDRPAVSRVAAPFERGPMGGGYDDAADREDDAPVDDAELISCSSCGRKFVERAFRVHQKVCQKVFQQKRKAFDSRKHRVNGTDQAKYVRKLDSVPPSPAAASKPSSMRRPDGGMSSQVSSSSETKGRGGPVGAPGPRSQKAVSSSLAHNDTPIKTAANTKAKWRQQSENFRNMLRQNRLIKQAEMSGRPIPKLPHVPSAPDPSLIQCPHCSRRFNESAAERHIPKCTSIIAKPKALSKGGGIALGAAARSLARTGSSSSLGGRRSSASGIRPR